MLALPEATSEHYLVRQFDELPDIIPVVRKVEIKFGELYKNEVLQTDRFPIMIR